MLNPELRTRIDTAKKTDTLSIDCNCFGTALFIAGVNDADKYTHSTDVINLLRDAGFSETDNEAPGDIVLICEKGFPLPGNEKIWHAGVLIDRDDRKIAHRRRLRWPDVEVERLAVAARPYTRKPTFRFFSRNNPL